jgi:hypothetical protein
MNAVHAADHEPQDAQGGAEACSAHHRSFTREGLIQLFFAG